jgi:hypothetical protein
MRFRRCESRCAPDGVKWNEFNGVVQCHRCGQVWQARPAGAVWRAWQQVLRAWGWS